MNGITSIIGVHPNNGWHTIANCIMVTRVAPWAELLSAFQAFTGDDAFVVGNAHITKITSRHQGCTLGWIVVGLSGLYGGRCICHWECAHYQNHIPSPGLHPGLNYCRPFRPRNFCAVYIWWCKNFTTFPPPIRQKWLILPPQNETYMILPTTHKINQITHTNYQYHHPTIQQLHYPGLRPPLL